MHDIVERLRRLVRPESPKREIEITFRVLQPAPHEPAPALNRLKITQKDSEQGNQAEYLKTCLREVRKLSRGNLSVPKRVLLNEEFIGYFLPVAFRHIQFYSKEGGVPDPDQRHDILESIIETVNLLTESYKIVFKNSYHGRGYALRSLAKHVDLGAFRILELTRLQQRVKALRYQLLSDAAWFVANTVFHAMHASGHADSPIATLESFVNEEDFPATQTMREVYLCIQMVSKFDIVRWPTEWQTHVFAYGKSIGALVQLAADGGAELPRATSVSYCYDRRPARARRAAAGTEPGPALLLKWSKLMRKVTSDFLSLFNEDIQGDRTNIPKELASLSYNEGLAFVQLQFERVTSENPQAAVDEGAGTACDMRIFIGFRSVYQLLRNIHHGKFEVGTRLDDVLAKRSAIFAEDDVATTESVWFLQFQDDAVIRLKTQETRFTTNMRIGLLAAYGIGTEGIAKPRFGVISRIFRPSAKAVIVDIFKLGEYIEPVVASTDLTAFSKKDNKNEIFLGAIVVKDTFGEAKLLVPPVTRLHAKTVLVMKRAQDRQTIVLGKMQSVTRDFYLFRFANAPSAESNG